MKKHMLHAASWIGLVVFIAVAIGSLNGAVKTKAPTRVDAALIDQGRYLVHNLGMCIDCHSPRTPDGQFIEDKHLTGSPLAFVATVPMPWASVAPSLAGLPPHYNREAMVHFLMTGERPGGLPPALPPMPSVRMSEKDARAVTAYLMSLKSE